MEEINLGGRPTKYKASMNALVFKLALLGATDKEMADCLEINKDTLNEWKVKYPKFSVSINKGKLKADAEVAKSLYKRANGFEYDEVTFEKTGQLVAVVDAGTGELKQEPEYKKKVVTKLIPPDVAAQNIWLKNRRSKVEPEGIRWADKHEVGMTDNNGDDVRPILQLIPAQNCDPINSED
jgi:hypothetical protein